MLGSRIPPNIWTIYTRTSQTPKTLDEQIPHLTTKEDLADVNSELKQGISQAKVDMIKWFVTFFITLAFMIVGLYFK